MAAYGGAQRQRGETASFGRDAVDAVDGCGRVGETTVAQPRFRRLDVDGAPRRYAASDTLIAQRAVPPANLMRVARAR